ncbi:hypothetical protein SSS_04681, partial [Sarcoptes scabiei]
MSKPTKFYKKTVMFEIIPEVALRMGLIFSMETVILLTMNETNIRKFFLMFLKGCVKNPKEAMKYFTKSCELDDAMGCDCAGKIYGGFETHLHDVIEPDPVKGLKYLDRGCNIKSTSQLFESTESCYA